MSLSILDLTVSLVDRRTFEIDPYAGNSLDAATHNDHFYSGLAPGTSIAAIPFYLAIKPMLAIVSTPERERRVDDLFLGSETSWRPSERRLTILILDFVVCVFGCSILAGAIAVLFFKTLQNLYPDIRESRLLLTTWLFSFATLFFYYSNCIEHRLISTSLCFWAYTSFLDPTPMVSRRRSVCTGLALGFAIATTYEVGIVVLCVVAFGWLRWRMRWPWVWTILAGTIVMIVLSAYHTTCFGKPWATPYGSRISLANAPTAFQRPMLDSIFDAFRRPLGRIFDLCFGVRYGFFFFSPLLILAIPGFIQSRANERLRSTGIMALAIFGSLMTIHFFSGYEGTPGEFGFRFMLPAIPWLMLLLPTTYSWSYGAVLPILTALSAMILAKGIMYGSSTDGDFWGSYGRMFRRYGISSYTMSNLKDHIFPQASPLVASLLQLAIVGATLWVIYHVVWSTRGETRDQSDSSTITVE